MDPCIVGFERDRFVEARDRIVRMSEVLQDDAEIVVAFRIIRLQRQCISEAPQRFVRPLQAGQHDATAIMRLGIAGIDGDGRIERFERLIVTT